MHVEAEAVANDQAPGACYRYLVNRPGQFKHREAISANLPIGSGEVESAHRYVIQERLKLADAWRHPANAQAMPICESGGSITAGSVMGMPPPRNTAYYFRLHPLKTIGKTKKFARNRLKSMQRRPAFITAS